MARRGSGMVGKARKPASAQHASRPRSARANGRRSAWRKRSADALLLIDDRASIEAARARGVRATREPCGILARAARSGLVDLPTAFVLLIGDEFSVSP